MHPRSRLTLTPFLVLTLASFAACGSEGESAETRSAEVPVRTASGSAPATVEAAQPADRPVLVPSVSFALEDAAHVTGVAMAPDGSRIAVATQERLGTPVTLRLYDASTGEVVATAQADVIGLGRLHWMADNRLVSADRNADPAWRSWDGNTLAALPSLPQDVTCADGPTDKNTGAVYSSEGMVSMSDVLCRFNTTNGSILRSAEGVLVGAERFWVQPRSGEAAVVHSPNPEESLQLVLLDGSTLTPNSSTVIQFSESVEAVGARAWVTNNDARTSRLEPGAVPVPYMSSLRASGAGSVFIYSNGTDDFVFMSALDGSEIGTMPAGMNLSPFADWSIDDSSFVRLTLDGQAEIYLF